LEFLRIPSNTDETHPMKISVLIPSYNRKEWLLKTLDWIVAQTYKNFEVVIVDASDPLDQLDTDILNKYPFPLKYVRYGIAGNVSKQRNIALKAASGDLLLFLDDDVSFQDNFFQEYVRLFSSGKYSAISGLVETQKHKRGSPPLEYKDNRLLRIGALNYLACDFEIETYVICTANFAFTRQIYSLVGGFDELMFGIFDDVNYGWQLKNSGVKVMHVPSVAVFHFQATASGARSSSLPGWWKYYNMIYFHLKNLKPNHFVFFVASSWSVFHPSRQWLKLQRLIKEYIFFCRGFVLASKNVRE
jgi:GT2 family glycosyltransferase